jgi:hypothetical protein
MLPGAGVPHPLPGPPAPGGYTPDTGSEVQPAAWPRLRVRRGGSDSGPGWASHPLLPGIGMDLEPPQLRRVESSTLE